MKKLTLFALALTLTLSMAGFASAKGMGHGNDNGGMNHGSMNSGSMDHSNMSSDSGMDHGNMNMEGAANAHKGMMQMETNLELMKKDVEAMKSAAGRDAAMKAMNKHMMDMHMGMKSVKDHAHSTGNTGMQKSMKRLDKDMMTTMKGMGLMKKNPDQAVPMMMEGLEGMESTVDSMKGQM
jgi:hypothetical protein